MLAKNFKIVLSPYNSNIEVVGPMIIDVRAPYDSRSLTLLINPNITHYEDKPKLPQRIEIRQFMVSENTDETKTMKMNLGSENEKHIEFNGKKYKIKLLNIGKEKIRGDDFPFFEFFIEEQNVS